MLTHEGERKKKYWVEKENEKEENEKKNAEIISPETPSPTGQ